MSDKNTISARVAVIAAIFVSRLVDTQVRLRELQFCEWICNESILNWILLPLLSLLPLAAPARVKKLTKIVTYRRGGATQNRIESTQTRRDDYFQAAVI